MVLQPLTSFFLISQAGKNRPDLVHRSSFYCTIKMPVLWVVLKICSPLAWFSCHHRVSLGPGFSAVALLVSLGIESQTLQLYWSTSHTHTSHSTDGYIASPTLAGLSPNGWKHWSRLGLSAPSTDVYCLCHHRHTVRHLSAVRSQVLQPESGSVLRSSPNFRVLSLTSLSPAVSITRITFIPDYLTYVCTYSSHGCFHDFWHSGRN